MPIRALIFDFDGLVVDTETADFQAWQRLLAPYGHQLPWELWAESIGTRALVDPPEWLAAQTGQAIDTARLRTQHGELHREMILASDCLPGVRDRLQEATLLGLRVGMASSSPASWVLPQLERLQIRDVFSCVMTGDQVPRVKPDPALYRLALECLGVRPAEALAFEDSLNGLVAAQAAGLRTVVVPNPTTAAMDFRDADLVLSSLAAMDLKSLFAVVADAG
jgi:HAD superfamily hydrolase (TIGR01509 family)